MLTQLASATAVCAEGPSAALLSTLLDALESERRLLDDLIEIMQRQRRSVAADDLQAVDETVYATHRVLHTLGEARRRRHSLNRAFGEPDETGIRGLDDVLGGWMTDAIRAARDELQAAARSLSREIEINRHVLREALAAGDDYVRAIYGTPQPKLLYSGDASRTEVKRQGGVLLNRTA